MLHEDERILLMRLSVFTNGWDLPAAEAVCAGEPIAMEQVALILEELVAHSLVQVREPVAGEPYLGMLETVQEFAREQLAASGEEPTLRRRHAEYFAALAERIGPQRYANDPTSAEVERLATALDNLRAAVTWSAATREALDLYGRMVNVVWWLWLRAGLTDELRIWVADALNRMQGMSVAGQAHVLNAAAELAFRIIATGRTMRSRRIRSGDGSATYGAQPIRLSSPAVHCAS